jgi:hypothetical protein
LKSTSFDKPIINQLQLLLKPELYKYMNISYSFIYSQWLTLADFVCYMKKSVKIPKG